MPASIMKQTPNREPMENSDGYVKELSSERQEWTIQEASLSDAIPADKRAPRRTLAVALLGFFIITLDALVVSVALPAIENSIGGGITGLQWVMDGYTLPFAAMLLFAGTLSDRIGARTAFGAGLVLFVASSVACTFANGIELLIAARFVQGIGAAMMTPASLAMIGEAFPNPVEKARAIGVWAAGGAVASASGPLVGGALTMLSWRLIFLINLPVGAIALWLLWGVPKSPRRPAPFDWGGQLTSFVALMALVFALIKAGEVGLAETEVLVSLLISAIAGTLFFALQAKGTHPMVPLGLFRTYPSALPLAIGFTFMVGFYGMVFLISLFLQEERGLSSLQTGLAFVPVTAFSIFMPMIAARLGERMGVWCPIALGQASMIVGLLGLSWFAETAPVWAIVGWMIPVGLGGGLAMPSTTSLLLNAVPAARAGTASGVLNTCRQVGGAIAIAAFGALITAWGSQVGTQTSLMISATLLGVTALASLALGSGKQASET